MKYRPPFLIVLLIFLLVNIAFNINIWREIIQFDKVDYIQIGDGPAFETLTEEVYQKLINFENPFLIKKTFYPFETNISLSDPAITYGILFIPFRALFETHQSMMIIVMLNLFLSEIGMYLLLKRFKIITGIAIIFSLVYAFTPFISIRIGGHYTYTSIYFFPLILYACIEFLNEKIRSKKIILSASISILFALLLMSNFYFFIATLFVGALYLLFYFWQDTKKTFRRIFAEFGYLIFSIFLFLLILAPWLLAVNQYILFDDVVQTPGFGGAIELSADLLSFITPSEANPFYRYLVVTLSSLFPLFVKYKIFYISYGMHFAYVGIIILLTYFYLLTFWKKIKKSLMSLIFPHFIISLFLATLLLGPFLKIANRWMIVLDGVAVVIPLPFLAVHYIPVLNMMRDPSRLLPIVVFLGCIVSAIVINNFYLRTKNKRIVIIFLFLVFIFDQFYLDFARITQKIPHKLFNTISKDNDDYSVLSIPFTLRDGFRYIGFVHDPMNHYGTVFHNHPVIGGYAARVGTQVFDYYKNLSFISYIAESVDKGNYNPYTHTPKNNKLLPFKGSKKDVENQIEFLNIKYVALKNDESYSQGMANFLQANRYKKILNDGQYDLYKIKLMNKSYDQVNFGSRFDQLSVVSGLSEQINSEYRIVTDDVVKIFLKPKNDKILYFKADSNKSVDVDFYINKKFIGSKMLTPQEKRHEISTSDSIKKQSINEIILKFDKKILENDAMIKFYILGLDK